MASTWRPENTTKLGVLEHTTEIEQCDISSNDDYTCSIHKDSIAIVCDLETGKTYPIENVYSCLWSVEGAKLLVCTKSGGLVIYQVFPLGGVEKEKSLEPPEFMELLLERNLDYTRLSRTRCLYFSPETGILQTSHSHLVSLAWAAHRPRVSWHIEFDQKSRISVCSTGVYILANNTISLHGLDSGNVQETIDLSFLGVDFPVTCLTTFQSHVVLVGKDTIRVVSKNSNVWQIARTVSKPGCNVQTCQFVDNCLFFVGQNEHNRIFVHEDWSSEDPLHEVFIIPQSAKLLMRRGTALVIHNQDVYYLHKRFSLDFLSCALEAGNSHNVQLYLHMMANHHKALLPGMDMLVNYLKAHQSSFTSEVLDLSIKCAKKVLGCPAVEEDHSLQLFRYMQLLQKLASQSREVIDKTQEKKIVKKWERWNDDAIIQDAVNLNLITLAQSVLIARGRKEWVVSQRIRQLAKDMIQSLALRKDGPQEAERIVRNLGWDVSETWTNLLLMTKDVKLREILVSLLEEKSLLTSRLTEALEFLTILRHTKYHATVLNDVVNWDEKKRQRVAAEIYLATQDEQLLPKISLEDYWSLLIERFEFDKVKAWIDAVCLNDTPDSSVSPWPLTEVMIEVARNQSEILDHLAKYGIFGRSEREDVPSIIHRLKSLQLLRELPRILASPTANVTFQQFLRLLICLCLKNQWTHVLHTYTPLWREELEQLGAECLQAPILLSFADWESNTHQIEAIGNLVYQTWLLEASEEGSKPYTSALLLIVQSLCAEKRWVEDQILWVDIKKSFWLRWACQPMPTPQPALEEYLDVIPLAKGYWERWKGHVDSTDEWPHFSHPTLAAEYGFGDTLGYRYYLQQSRPASAFAKAVKDHSGDWSKATRFRLAQSCHGLAMTHIFNSSIAGSCLAFLEYMGHDSTPLKCTLNLLHTVWQHGLNEFTERGEKRLQRQTEWEQEIFTLGKALILERQRMGPKLLSMLEEALLALDSKDFVADTVRWSAVVQFSQFYDLPLSDKLLKRFAEREQALHFLLCAHWFQYPQALVMAASESFPSQVMKQNIRKILCLDPEMAQSYLAGEEVTTVPKEAKLGQEDIYSTIVQCQLSPNPHRVLLKEGVARKNLDLIVIATLEAGKESDCFMAYLCVTLSRGESYKPSMTLDEVENILEWAIREKKLILLKKAFQIFYPEHPLNHLFSFLLENVPAAKEAYGRFVEAMLVLSSDDGFWGQAWSQSVAWHLVDWTLFDGLSTVSAKLALLRKLCQIEEVSSFRPSYKLSLTLFECVGPLGVNLNLPALQDPESVAYQCETLSVVRLLTERSQFQVAQEFAALAGLSPESIILYQLSSSCEQLLASELEPSARCRFWQRTHKQLTNQKIAPLIAGGFFEDHVTKAQSSIEKFVILHYALHWKRQIHGFASKPDWVQLEKEMWINRLCTEEDFDLEEYHTFSKLLKASVTSAAARFKIVDFNCSVLKQVLHRCLNMGDLSTACRLTTICDYEQTDTAILLLMLSIAEEEPVAALRDGLQRLVDLTFIKGDRKERLTLVKQLLGKVQHGKQLAHKIYAGLGVAVALDLKYQYLLQHPHPTSILKMILDWEERETANSKIQLARDWIAAVDLREGDIVEVVYEELFNTAQKIQDPEQESNMLLSFLQGQSQRLLSLCPNPALVGQRLLDASTQLALGTRVEVLIMAHTCFSQSCDTEGIGNVLKSSRTLVHQLKEEQEWGFMVRLLTGIQRYTEMNYVFEILQENNRFEFLLRRGMDRLPLLKVALLDFLRRSSSEDRELFRLVALHFHMYDQVANLWREDGDNALQQIASTYKTSPNGLSLELVKPLRSAMQSFAHAAEFFAKAGKLLHAQKCISQAELAAVQLNLLSSPSTQQHSVLGLTPSQLNAVAVAALSYPQAMIVAKAYGYKLDWGLVVYRRFVVQGDESYLTYLQNNIPCLLACMDDVVSHVDRNLPPEGLSRMARLLTLLPYIDVQYRLASQLGLKDLVERLLSSPNACYLQDTVFKTGSQVDN